MTEREPDNIEQEINIIARQSDNAEQALMELEQTGQTQRHCLRCGGRLLFHDPGFGTDTWRGYTVWCERGDYTGGARA